jgi:hypothetical protein
MLVLLGLKSTIVGSNVCSLSVTLSDRLESGYHHEEDEDVYYQESCNRTPRKRRLNLLSHITEGMIAPLTRSLPNHELCHRTDDLTHY